MGCRSVRGFFASLRSRGLALNAFAAAIVALGVTLAAVGIGFHWVEVPAGVGLLSGATTNTPNLAAAQQALEQVKVAESATVIQGLAYAVAYPFGIIGIILTMLLVRSVFHIDTKAEVAAAESAQTPPIPKPATRNFEVRNANLVGRTLGKVPALASSGVVVSRFSRDGKVDVARPDTVLRMGDILHAVGPEDGLDELRVVAGAEAGVDLKTLPGPVTNRRLIPVAFPGLPGAMKLGGLRSGEKFVEVLLGASGVHWLLYGAIVTAVPLVAVGLLARLWKKMNYAEICGLLAGSMTDPPALAFAQQSTGSDAPAVAGATVYPIVMLLRVFSAQLLVFVFAELA
ncbi:MAG TPA: TrkA C-terminal domain-containing protein [Opitutaceae bacterium]|nr:TrkA C-terminal domain-containing protein [Opitutaceae bacterium]